MIEIRRKLTVGVVIPAYNEAPFISTVIRASEDVDEVDEVLVVDDGSTDTTREVAAREGARVVSHETNRGKGEAMKTGLRRTESDILVFLDADLSNITPEKIRRIIEPFKGGVDFVKTRFERRGGRVTQLTARPMLSRFFSEIDELFDQPLSGQVGIKRDLMARLELEPDTGVDVGLLIDVVESGARVTEVCIGSLDHDERELGDLENMAKSVSRVILDRAVQYGRIHEAIAEFTEAS